MVKSFMEFVQAKNAIHMESSHEIMQQITQLQLPEELKNLAKAAYGISRSSSTSGSVSLMKHMPKYDDIAPPMDAHGIAKLGTSGNLKSLMMFLQAGIIPKSVFTAPLFLSKENAGVGAGFGTSGTAYRDGDFIIASEPNKKLHVDGIKYILVAENFADINPKILGGKNPIDVLQKELGAGKYKFVAVGDTNNDLDSFVREISAKDQSSLSNQPNQPKQEEPISVKQILQKMNINPDTDAEIIPYPNEQPPRIGVRNRKKGTSGFGKIIYLDTTKKDYNQFSKELQQSFA